MDHHRMLPTAITLRNYRAFATPVTLELRPITLLYGVNNAGKSALLRALPILGDSVGPDASGPLHLDCPAAFESTFPDIRWKGVEEAADPDLGLSLQWEDGESIEYALTWFADWRRVIIRRFHLRNSKGESLVEAAWVPRREERLALELTYDWSFQGGLSSQGGFIFQGLTPVAMPDACVHNLDTLATRLRGLNRQVQWLAAARSTPRRISTYPSAPRWRLRHDGSDVGQVVATHSEVAAQVSGWYERHLKRALAIQDRPPSEFRLVLRNLLRPELDIDLIDTGEGMIQVLPVLAALALGRLSSEGGPKILAIEEPESHLHSHMQRALAEEICSVARAKPSPRIVLETHSEHLLLGVQLEIVKGQLSTDDVVLYWIRQLETGESVAERITFDEEARPQGNWPPRVFADDTEVAREIIQTRRERSTS